MEGGRADGRRMGGREADGRTGGGRADRRTWGKGEADGQTARRLEADGRMKADGARTGQTSSRADGRTSRGFKRPRTLFPSSLSSAQTTRLTAERVCRALGSALGPSRVYVNFFLLRTTYLQFRHSTIVKCVPELFWHYLEL